MADRSTYKYRHQPFKTVYLLYHAITSAAFVIPWYIIYYTPKSNRQRPSWDRGRAVRVSVILHCNKCETMSLKLFIDCVYTILLENSRKVCDNYRLFEDFVFTGHKSVGPFLPRPTYKAIKPNKEVEGVWIPPIPSSMIQGDVAKYASVANVISVQIPGYWYGGKPDDVITPGEKVYYSLHGGSYVALSAHPDSFAAEIPRGLMQYTSIKRAFALEYRLSNYKPFEVCGPFPTALIDAIAGYVFLVNLGYAASDIIVEGDSAGANLALALVRYLIEEGGANGIPSPPGGLILLSPWSDLSKSNILPGGSGYFDCDYLGPYSEDDPQWAHHAFLHPFGLEIANTNRFISPASIHPDAHIDFKGYPRTFITGGGAEILRDQIRTLEEKMKVDCDVEYFEAVDAVHDWITFAWHEPERSEALTRIGKWVGK